MIKEYTRRLSAIILLCMACIGTTACANSSQSDTRNITGVDADTDTIEATNAAPTEANSSDTQNDNFGSYILHFLDAHLESHEAEIDPSTSMHDYNLDNLNNSSRFYSYEDDQYTSRSGIDVSKYQGNIDWKAVKNDGIDFVFIRAAYRGYGESGTLKEDEYFKASFKGAREAGLDVGIYIFSQAINEEEAREEAEFAISLLDGSELQMPVVFDPETIKNDEARTDNVTGEQFTRNTIAFCERVKELGYEPMVYTNMMWEAFTFDMKALKDYPFWYADYEAMPQTPYDFSIWQYSEKGQVAGVDGNCDLDIQFIKK